MTKPRLRLAYQTQHCIRGHQLDRGAKVHRPEFDECNGSARRYDLGGRLLMLLTLPMNVPSFVYAAA
jgi:hypothetical protein